MEKTKTLQRGCPLTGGAPIKITQGAFDRCCAAKKEAACEERKKNHHLTKGSGFNFSWPCLACSGPPAELTIINVEDIKPPDRKPEPKRQEPQPIPAAWNHGRKYSARGVPADRIAFLRNGYQWMPIAKLCRAFNQQFGERQTELDICELLVRCRVPSGHRQPATRG